MFSSHFSEYGKSRLHYIKAGNGKEVMIFFHGFGQDHSVYIPIIQTLADRYTLYIFDVYFHGKSEWQEQHVPLRPSEWKLIFAHFLKENGIEEFSLSGYSLGGKFVFSTLVCFQSQCKNLFLIAPDGIATSIWYLLAVYPFRNFFRSLINQEHRLQVILRLVMKTKWVDKSLIRFADYQMNTHEKRNRVYNAWVLFRLLSFSRDKLTRIIKQYGIDITIVIGKYDPVIPVGPIQKFMSAITHGRLIIVEAGHTGLLSNQVFREYLLRQNLK